MLQPRLALSAHTAPLYTPPAPGAHLHVEHLDASWEWALEAHPDFFSDIRSVSVGEPLKDDQAARLRERLAARRPLAGATQISGLRPHALLAGLRLGASERAVTGAHLASADGLPPAPTRPRSDVLQLFAQHPQLRVASVCRSLISADRINNAINFQLVSENMRRRRQKQALLVFDDDMRRQQVEQALSIDIARTLYCVAKDLEQVPAESLSQVMVLFDVKGVTDFQQTLWVALRLPSDLHDTTSPWVGQILQNTRAGSAAQRPLTWEFGYGTPEADQWGVVRFEGDHFTRWTLTPVVPWTFLPRPFAWSTLCASMPPPGLT